MSTSDKMFYTVAEVLNRLNITHRQLSRKLLALNIEIRHLPGSNREYIAARDVERIEQNQKSGLFND
jgi:hypothetical protein